MDLSQVLEMSIILIICLIFILVAAYAFILFKNRNKEKLTKGLNKSNNKVGIGSNKTNSGYSKQSVYDFMEFDEIKDNMIIRKNRTQYVMVIKCKGVNYDLMSEEEKVAVESGFVQFLNVLRFPVQLYVQTTSLNLKDIIAGYKERLLEMEREIQKVEQDMQTARAKGNGNLYNRLAFEKRRRENVLEYTADISDYIAKLSMNQNVLQQKNYVVVSYYVSELGTTQNVSKNEIDSMCFSELYTRAQTIVHALGSASVVGKILDSEELSELLYAAYNRDESEIMQLSKALDAEYDSLYSTGKDVLEKRKEALDEMIEREAIDLATDSISIADEKIKNEQKIMEKAMEIVGEYKDQMSEQLYNKTIEVLENKPEEKNENKEATPGKRGRPRKVEA